MSKLKVVSIKKVDSINYFKAKLFDWWS